MPSKRDLDENPSSRKRTKHKESKSGRYDRKICRVKAKVRTELDAFAWTKWKFCQNDYWICNFVDVLPRIDYRSTSKEEFIKKYEEPNIPVIITHMTDRWPSHKYWNEDYFLERYGSHLFKVGEDDDDNNVYLKMKHFLHYCSHEGQHDDSPLYIFDSGFYKDRRSRKSKTDHPNLLLNEYTVPSYFEDDLFRLTGERRRPPYRWIVIGSGRSGTGIHTDPLGTSAWNALLKGHKRWCLFPPGTPKSIVDPPMKPYDHEAVSWFSTVFPKFLRRDSEHDNLTLGERLGMIQVLQRPGETIFVPGGWPHVVMNLDMTFAVTQNFCSPTNAEYVYLSTRHSRPKLGAKLYNKIQELGQVDPTRYADLAKRLQTLQTVPQLPPSSSSSSSSTSSSSSSSSSSPGVSSTESETDLSDGTCMCHKCKRKRKRETALKQKRTA